jgi:hypothetical protein
MRFTRLICSTCLTTAWGARCKYALTVVDVASQYKEAEALTDNSAAEVAAALGRIYTREPLQFPLLLH